MFFSLQKYDFLSHKCRILFEFFSHNFTALFVYLLSFMAFIFSAHLNSVFNMKSWRKMEASVFWQRFSAWIKLYWRLLSWRLLLWAQNLDEVSRCDLKPGRKWLFLTQWRVIRSSSGWPRVRVNFDSTRGDESGSSWFSWRAHASDGGADWNASFTFWTETQSRRSDKATCASCCAVPSQVFGFFCGVVSELHVCPWVADSNPFYLDSLQCFCSTSDPNHPALLLLFGPFPITDPSFQSFHD